MKRFPPLLGMSATSNRNSDMFAGTRWPCPPELGGPNENTRKSAATAKEVARKVAAVEEQRKGFLLFLFLLLRGDGGGIESSSSCSSSCSLSPNRFSDICFVPFPLSCRFPQQVSSFCFCGFWVCQRLSVLGSQYVVQQHALQQQLKNMKKPEEERWREGVYASFAKACVCLERVKGKGYLAGFCPWHCMPHD